MLRYPNESDSYREMRNQLLEKEKKLRLLSNEVANLRSKLPLGGELKEEYVFSGGSGEVPFLKLFEDRSTLLLYSFMFAPDADQPCPLCTSFIDNLNGNALHLQDRLSLVICAKSPYSQIMDFAKSRGWDRLKFVSSENNTYNRDYFGENDEWGQAPMLNVFTKNESGKIHHFWGSEMLFQKPEEAQDPRHLDVVWPIWGLFEMTPEGRGQKWYPKISYTQN